MHPKEVARIWGLRVDGGQCGPRARGKRRRIGQLGKRGQRDVHVAAAKHGTVVRGAIGEIERQTEAGSRVERRRFVHSVAPYASSTRRSPYLTMGGRSDQGKLIQRSVCFHTYSQFTRDVGFW